MAIRTAGTYKMKKLRQCQSDVFVVTVSQIIFRLERNFMSLFAAKTDTCENYDVRGLCLPTARSMSVKPVISWTVVTRWLY